MTEFSQCWVELEFHTLMPAWRIDSWCDQWDHGTKMTTFYVLFCMYFFCNRSAMQRVPLRLWRSTSQRWGRFTGQTGRACRESRPGRLFLVMWWRFLVRDPKLGSFLFTALPAACAQSWFSHRKSSSSHQNHCANIYTWCRIHHYGQQHRSKSK